MNEGISESVKRHVRQNSQKNMLKLQRWGTWFVYVVCITFRVKTQRLMVPHFGVSVPHFGAPALIFRRASGIGMVFFFFPSDFSCTMQHNSDSILNEFLNWGSTAKKGVSNMVPNSSWLHTPSPSDVYGPVKIHPEKPKSVFKYCIWVTITVFLAKYSKLLQTIFHNQPSSRYVCPIPSRLMTINSPRRIGFLKCWYPNSWIVYHGTSWDILRQWMITGGTLMRKPPVGQAAWGQTLSSLARSRASWLISAWTIPGRSGKICLDLCPEIHICRFPKMVVTQNYGFRY